MLAALRTEPFNPLAPPAGGEARGPAWAVGEYPPPTPGLEAQQSPARKMREEQGLGADWEAPARHAWALFDPAQPPAAPMRAATLAAAAK